MLPILGDQSLRALTYQGYLLMFSFWFSAINRLMQSFQSQIYDFIFSQQSSSKASVLLSLTLLLQSFNRNRLSLSFFTRLLCLAVTSPNCDSRSWILLMYCFLISSSFSPKLSRQLFWIYSIQYSYQVTACSSCLTLSSAELS